MNEMKKIPEKWKSIKKKKLIIHEATVYNKCYRKQKKPHKINNNDNN